MTNGAVITTSEYAGNYIYRNNALQFISQPEGYLELDGQGGYDYGYRLKDHLGNIRLTFVDFDHNGSIALSEITEENNYYPFGLKHQGYNNIVNSNTNAVASKFKYNGKELNDELGLDLYDYGARFYDAALGRWHVVDKLAENAYNWTPYRYGFNNPILYLDQNGNFELKNSHKYNRLAHYLSSDVKGLLSNNRIIRGLQHYGSLSNSQIRKDFEWTKGPSIIVVNDLQTKTGLRANGIYDPVTNTISLDESLVMELENASGADIDAAVVLVIKKLLHEYVHRGEFLSNGKFSSKYEMGDGFEDWVYGAQIENMKDAIKYMEEYRKKKEEEQNENKKKEKGFNNIINNLSNLESGTTYIWNGSDWVEE